MAAFCAKAQTIAPVPRTMPHVVVLFHRLGPYHFARLQAAATVLPILAIETFGVDETYAWDSIPGAGHFERVTLFQRADAQTLPTVEVVQRVQSALDKADPAVVVIPGWSDCAALGALQWSLKNHIPAIVMSDSTVWDEKRVWWKEWIKSRLVTLCSAGLAAGAPHADYLARLGMARDRTFLGYDAVDNDYFADKAEQIRSQRSDVRSRHGLPKKYFLASARFVEKKNLSRLIEAYSRYRELATKGNDEKPTVQIWNLILMGDGPLRSKIESQLSTLKLRDHVLLPGFKQYAELPTYYAFAGAFVHASVTEQWGLVINEAMASGLPVLVSNRCGCATDLVRQGRNGFTFDPYNVEELAQLMLKVSTIDFPLGGLGMASSEIISQWGTARFVRGLTNAVETALRNVRPQGSWMDRLILRQLMSR